MRKNNNKHIWHILYPFFRFGIFRNVINLIFFLFIKDLSCYVNRCNEVVMNILQQLSALYTPPGVQNGPLVFYIRRFSPNFLLDPFALWMSPICIYQYEIFPHF